MLNKLLRAKEVAEILDISRSYAYRLLQRGQIPSVQIGKCRRVRVKDLEGFIASNVISPVKSQIPTKATHEQEPKPSECREERSL